MFGSRLSFRAGAADTQWRTTVSLRRFHTIVFACAALLGVEAARVHAQDVTEVSLKGAFIFNFARFTNWPAEALPSAGSISACVVGDRGVSEALRRSVSGRNLNGRAIVVSFIEPDGALPGCHFLYVSRVSRTRLAEIIYRLHGTPVLTVSDDDAFIKLGGMIQVYIESGKMRFRINPKSAKRAGLQLSSRLLALADLVDADPPPPPPSMAGSTSKAR